MTFRTSTRPLACATLVLGLVAGTQAIGQVDTLDLDGDGYVSYDEMVVVVPTFTQEDFDDIDTDGDGLLSEEELTAAQEAGVVVLD